MRRLVSVLALAGVLGIASPALAEHMTLVAPEPDRPAAASWAPTARMDVDVSIGRDGFRLGARVFGEGGVHGAWLNGARTPDGFRLDGRVQRPDRAFDFTLNLDVEPWARRALDGLLAP
jgi:hypothetical protein